MKEMEKRYCMAEAVHNQINNVITKRIKQGLGSAYIGKILDDLFKSFHRRWEKYQQSIKSIIGLTTACCPGICDLKRNRR